MESWLSSWLRMEFILDSRERGRSFTEVSWGGMEDGGVEEVGGG